MGVIEAGAELLYFSDKRTDGWMGRSDNSTMSALRCSCS